MARHGGSMASLIPSTSTGDGQIPVAFHRLIRFSAQKSQNARWASEAAIVQPSPVWRFRSASLNRATLARSRRSSTAFSATKLSIPFGPMQPRDARG